MLANQISKATKKLLKSSHGCVDIAIPVKTVPCALSIFKRMAECRGRPFSVVSVDNSDYGVITKAILNCEKQAVISVLTSADEYLHVRKIDIVLDNNLSKDLIHAHKALIIVVKHTDPLHTGETV